jgi:hypothetical protein
MVSPELGLSVPINQDGFPRVSALWAQSVKIKVEENGKKI